MLRVTGLSSEIKILWYFDEEIACVNLDFNFFQRFRDFNRLFSTTVESRGLTRREENLSIHVSNTVKVTTSNQSLNP